MGTEEDFLSPLKAGQRKGHQQLNIWGKILEQKVGFLPMFLHKKAEKYFFKVKTTAHVQWYL